jgi:TnpA family transposase
VLNQRAGAITIVGAKGGKTRTIDLHNEARKALYDRLMRRLAAAPRKAGVARALTAIGRIERTRFTLKYLRDEALQRQIQAGLNHGESVNGLARALLFGRRGMLRDRAVADQTRRASCLLLLMAAIALWNTTYLADAVAALRAQGETIPADLLAHLSPMGWAHINRRPC